MIDRNKVFIIAEAGVNHNGQMTLAKKLVDAAKEAGADAIKFQTFNAKRLASVKAPKARYQKRTTSSQESQLEMLEKLELTEAQHRLIMTYCRHKGITFISSPFDELSADLLDKLGVGIYKIPSGEVTNLAFLSHVAKKRKPVILSTGMSTLKEVKDAVEAMITAGVPSLTLLHCVTEYPAPIKELNLKAIQTLQNEFHLPVGFSDHSQGIEAAIAAVALGARVIEKHLTIGRSLRGPDHGASLEPNEFKDMVSAIRRIEEALGDGIKQPAACEKKNLTIARKSIVAQERIKKGSKILREVITFKRPGSGIAPREIDKVVGRTAKVTIQKDELIRWGQLV